MLRGLSGPGGHRPSPVVTCVFTCPPLAPPPASLLTWAGRTPAAAARWGQREVSRDDKPGWTKGLLGPGPPCCPGEMLGPGGRREVHAQGFVKMRPRAGTWGRGGGAPSQSFRASAQLSPGRRPQPPVPWVLPPLRCGAGEGPGLCFLSLLPIRDGEGQRALERDRGRREGRKERRKRKKKDSIASCPWGQRRKVARGGRTWRSGWGGQRGR